MFFKYFTDFTGRWDFVPAIRNARELSPKTWELDKDTPWPIQSVSLIGI